MGVYTRDELSEALEVISSTISKCEKIQPKFAEGTSQHSLLKNRIKALYISKALITEDSEIERYSKEELSDALKPIASVIHKCEAAQKKHDPASIHYKNLQKIINAMNIAKSLVGDEISNR